jgi:hypothetical protein
MRHALGPEPGDATPAQLQPLRAPHSLSAARIEARPWPLSQGMPRLPSYQATRKPSRRSLDTVTIFPSMEIIALIFAQIFQRSATSRETCAPSP